MNKLITLTLFFIFHFSAFAQIRLLPIDSSYFYNDFGRIGIELTKRHSIRYTLNLGGNMEIRNFVLSAENCSISETGQFSFNRRDIYTYNKDIIISASKNENKYFGSLNLKLPKPTSFQLSEIIDSIRFGYDYQLDFDITFDNNQIVNTKNYPNLLKLISHAELPQGVNINSGILKYNGKNYLKELKCKFFFNFDTTISTEIKRPISYYYTLNLSDNGRHGLNGGNGSTQSIFVNNINGGNGQNGSSGNNGFNASDMELYISKYDSNLVRISVRSASYNNEVFLIDLESGSEVFIDLIGGSGGNGGSGGSGGNGSSSSNSNEIGNGGQGGNGGNGGHGGDGGRLTIYLKKECKKYLKNIHLDNSGGQGGSGGERGSGGIGGTDYNKNLLENLLIKNNGSSGNRGMDGNQGRSGPPINIIELD